MEILRIENLSFQYPNRQKKALEQIDLTIESGAFVLICGQSGCGKTTLLRLMKRELAPAGEKSGRIFYKGTQLEELDEKISASQIGYVMQNPDNQIVTDKVWHELAFGLENMGLPTQVIRRRVGEMASYFGIQDWFGRDTDSLSGGQKQLLNLAAIMVMQPKILILDEPTSQLDPIAAADFIATLQKLNRELGLTILLVEHRLEEVFPIADKVLLLDEGRTLLYDSPRNVGAGLPKEHPMVLGLPSAVRIYNALQLQGQCPLTVKEGRDFLESRFVGTQATQQLPAGTDGQAALELRKVWFRYEKEEADVLRGTSLQVQKGELYCLLGGNGTGKTTTLNVLAGLHKPYRGKVLVDGKPIGSYKGNSLYRSKLAFLPQNPQTVFIKDTVREDFQDILQMLGVREQQRQAQIEAVSRRLQIPGLLERHPMDLSGGESQKCAIAKMLLLEPRILLMDEPTKGLDAFAKEQLQQILKELKKDGMTIMMVTHDVEFAAENADRCALFFDGEVLSADTPEKFFSENNFYTTAANRMARQLWPEAVTCRQVVASCKKEMDP